MRESTSSLSMGSGMVSLKMGCRCKSLGLAEQHLSFVSSFLSGGPLSTNIHQGYPEGQGVKVLKFLSTPGNIARLIANLDKLYSPTEEDFNAINAKVEDFLKEAQARYRQLSSMEDEPNENGESSDSKLQEELLNNEHIRRPMYYVCPSLSRDTGAEILDVIASSTEPIPAIPDLEFIFDSVFCEWAYVIDLDSDTLEAYAKGFKTLEGTRFDDLDLKKQHDEDGAKDAVDGPPMPPKVSPGLMGSWDLSMLPSEEQFLRDIEDVKRGDDESSQE